VPDNKELGKRIKRLRLSRNLTLKEVERKAQVSATHVSEIERGLTSPTVGVLLRIAAALGVPASHFVEEDGEGSVSVVRHPDRRTLFDPSGAATLASLSGGIRGRCLSVVEIELEPGHAERGTCPPHRGEEFAHVLRGVVEIRGGSGRRVLKEGDSIHLRADGSRTFHNIGDGPARLLWVATPPVSL
jgi:transcriptional regulator with XRE-family HTH domain